MEASAAPRLRKLASKLAMVALMSIWAVLPLEHRQIPAWTSDQKVMAARSAQSIHPFIHPYMRHEEGFLGPVDGAQGKKPQLSDLTRRGAIL